MAESQSDPIKGAVYKPLDASASLEKYKDTSVFHELEEDGIPVELPWSKVSTLFNFGRLLEQINKTESASILYRLILFKVCGRSS